MPFAKNPACQQSPARTGESLLTPKAIASTCRQAMYADLCILKVTVKAQNAQFTNRNIVHAIVHAIVLLRFAAASLRSIQFWLNASALQTAATRKGTHESHPLRHAAAWQHVCLQHQTHLESGVNVEGRSGMQHSVAIIPELQS